MNELDKVILPDERVGYILEAFNGDEAYLVEYAMPDGPDEYGDAVFKPEELSKAPDEQ